MRLLGLPALLLGMLAIATARVAPTNPGVTISRLQHRRLAKQEGAAAAALVRQQPNDNDGAAATATATAASFSRLLARRRGGAGRRLGDLAFEETEYDRGACLSRAWAFAAVQLGLIATALHLRYLPPALHPLLVEGGDKGLLQGVGAGAALNLVLVGLLASSSWTRRVPLNVLFLGIITAVKACLSVALAERFPATEQPLLLLTGQGGATMVVLALLASRNMGEGLLPYTAAAALTLLPARLVATLLKMEIRPVMLGGAGAFLVSVLLVFVTQSAVRGAAHRGGLEAVADVYVDVSRFLVRSVFPAKEPEDVMMGGRGRGGRR